MPIPAQSKFVIIEIHKTDISFNSFLSEREREREREQKSSDSKIKFSIVKVIDSLNKNNVIYSKVTEELNNLKNDIDRRTVQSISRSSFDSRVISTTPRRAYGSSRRE